MPLKKNQWNFTDIKQILMGVRQGSLLGLLLFLLYIKFFDASSGDSKVSMFEDDTTSIEARNFDEIPNTRECPIGFELANH